MTNPKTQRTQEQRDRDDAKVLALLKRGPATRATIKAETSIPSNHIDNALKRMAKVGKVQHDKASHTWKAAA